MKVCGSSVGAGAQGGCRAPVPGIRQECGGDRKGGANDGVLPAVLAPSGEGHREVDRVDKGANDVKA